MDEISLFRLEWNKYNGIIFHVLNLEFGEWEASLFALNIADNVYIDICFISMQFRLPWGNFH